MLQWISVWCFSVVLALSGINQKLVIDGDKDPGKAQVKLLKTKILFLENSRMKNLQEKYRFTIEIEHMLDYNLIVLKPIRSQELKSRLLTYGSQFYPTLFCIENSTKRETSSKLKPALKDTAQSALPEKQQENLWETIGIGFEWMSILFLSIAGLLLSLHRRRTIATLQESDNTMQKRQDMMEKEIESLEA